MGKKVMFLLNAGVGGAERMTVLYAKVLQKCGYQCTLVVIQSRKRPLNIVQFVPHGWTIKIIHSHFARLVEIPIFYFLLWHRFDVVFTSLAYLNNIIIKGKRLGIHRGKVVIRMNTMPSRLSPKTIIACKKNYPFADAIISQTTEMKEEMSMLLGLPEQRISVINNPIDKDYIQKCIKEDSSLEKGFVNYVTVGRVNEIKDQKTLIMAFCKVVAQDPLSRLYIVGSTDNQELVHELVQLTTHYGIVGKVYFEGFQRNPYKYMKNANVFVLSSIKEGLPNSVLEALYIGVPVVTTDCTPFLSQVVQEGKNGFVVPVGDVDALSWAMVKAASLGHICYDKESDSERKIKEVFDKL